MTHLVGSRYSSWVPLDSLQRTQKRSCKIKMRERFFRSLFFVPRENVGNAFMHSAGGTDESVSYKPFQTRQGGESGAPAVVGPEYLKDQTVKVLGSYRVRAGKILKRGGFRARERTSQRPLKLTSLVTFLFSDKKVTRSPLLHMDVSRTLSVAYPFLSLHRILQVRRDGTWRRNNIPTS